MRLARASRTGRPTRSSRRQGGGGGGAAIGEAWTQRAISTHAAANVREIGQIAEADDGRLVAVAYDRTFVSTDGGETFSENVVAGQQGQISYGDTPNRFACVSYSPNGLRYSSDGITWTTSGGLATSFSGLAWVPFLDRFVAMRTSSSFRVAYWSADGITWGEAETAGTSGSIEGTFVGPDHLITCWGSSGPRRRNNGVPPLAANWTAITGLDFRFLAVWAGSYGWRVVARGAASQLLYSSADGTAFSSLGALLPASSVWRGIQFDPATERLFLWGASGAYFSDDGGATWTAATGTVPTWDGSETYILPNGGFAPLAGKVFGGDNALCSSP